MQVLLSDSQTKWRTVYILVRWFHQKPSVLGLQCLQGRTNPSSTTQGVKTKWMHLKKNVIKIANEFLPPSTRGKWDQNMKLSFLLQYFQERLASVYQELGDESLSQVPFKVLIEQPLIQDIIQTCKTYKALVSWPFCFWQVFGVALHAKRLWFEYHIYPFFSGISPECQIQYPWTACRTG